jgi:hypothetical protein
MKTKTFNYEGKEYTCTEQDILSKIHGAKELVKCKKGKYGFDIVYKMKDGLYDDRDSSLVSTMLSYFKLIKKNKTKEFKPGPAQREYNKRLKEKMNKWDRGEN